MIRRASRLVAVAVVWTAALAGTAPGAGAQEAAQQGWWTVANAGTPVPPPAPPDVPADGLLIQGGANSASAYAALVYEVPADATVGTLTLAVAPNSGRTPNATPRLCQLGGTFTPAQGGPMADAPKFDCSKTSAGKPSSSGDGYQFDVSALVAAGTLAVAIL